MILPSIETPADVKGLNEEQLAELCEEIRTFIVDTVTTTGGHLGSNLGAVELTLALHRVFDSPRDVILWDTGHQAYVHKLLTGRRYGFKTLKQAGGMSGYPNRAESEHDWIENSHASTGLSYAHGIASGFELRGIDGERKVVAVVGDGALTGGMAYEALNNLGHSKRRVVIVLNDNGRSYAPTVSQLSQSLTTLRLNPTYTAARERLRLRLRELPALGELAYSGVHSVTSALRDMVAPHTFFEALGVRYAGPIDGHDIEHMEQAFTHAAEWDGPIVVHVLTQKGRGYAPAEQDDIQRLHDVKATSPVTLDNTVGNSAGRAVGGSATSDGGGIASLGSTPETAIAESPQHAATYTDAFSRALLAAAEEDPRVVALTAAMPGPTGLLAFQARFPDRFFDVGIAEQHGATSAAGMAMAGLRPVVAVYSTFWSRSFDQANLDVGLHGCPVVFVLDRAGITGDDGPSHHGILDLALALSIPGMTVFAPSSAEEVGPMLRTALELPGPSTIRVPKTAPRHVDPDDVGSGLQARQLRAGDGSVCLLGVGKTVGACLSAADELAAEGIEATVWDARVISPPDAAMLDDAAHHRLVVTAEDGVRHGGAGAFLLDAMATQVDAAGLPAPATRVLGVPRQYLAQGKADDILASLGPRRGRHRREHPPGQARRPGRAPPRLNGTRGPTALGQVGAVLAHEVVHRVVRLDRLPRVAPEAFLHVVGHLVLPDEVVVHVGDLQLAAAGRDEIADDVEHARLVAVDAGHAVVRGGMLGLLLYVRHPAVVAEDGHAEVAQVLGLGHLGQQDARADRIGAERLDHGPDGPLDDVVGQHDEHRPAPGEVLGQPERLGDAARLLLVRVGQLIDAVLAPVAEQAEELAGMGPPGDEHDLVDAARHHGLDRPGDHRAVVNRQEVFVRDPGQGMQARARSPRQDDALHDRARTAGCVGMARF